MLFRHTFRRLRRNNRGAVLVEFGVASLGIILCMLAVIELGLEVFARQSVMRANSRASHAYAQTGSVVAAREAAVAAVPVFMSKCLAPPEIRLFNSVKQIGPEGSAAGYPARDPGSDASAVVGRVVVTCDWSRLTPVMGSVLGRSTTVRTASYVRIQR